MHANGPDEALSSKSVSWVYIYFTPFELYAANLVENVFTEYQLKIRKMYQKKFSVRIETGVVNYKFPAAC